MANERLQIVLDAVWRGKGAVQKAERDLQGVDKAGERADNRLRNLAVGVGVATAALGTAAVAAREVWQLLGEGAALDRARQQFDNLADSIGTTADALLVDMRRATSGMMSDAELIASASDIINFGLADTAEGVTRLTTVVGTLGLDMQQVVLTFANNSKARLDALGLSVEAVNEKMKQLQAEGFDGDAFDEAVLISLEEKMTLLGDASDTTAGKMAQLETAAQNALNEFKVGLVEEFAGALGNTAEGAQDAEFAMVQMARNAAADIGQLITMIGGLPAALDNITFGINSWLNNAAAGIARFLGEAEIAQQLEFQSGRAAFAQRQVQRGTAAAFMADSASVMRSGSMYRPVAPPDRSAQIARETAAQRALAGEIDVTEVNLDALGMVVEDTQTKWGNYRASLDDATESTRGYGVAANAAEAELRGLASATGNFFEQARDMEELNPAEMLYDFAKAAGASALELADFGVAAGLFDADEANRNLMQAFRMMNLEQLGSMIAEGMAPEEALAAISQMEQDLQNNDQLARDFFAELDAQTNDPAMVALEMNTDPAQQEFEAFYDSLPDSKTIDLYFGTAGTSPSGGVTRNQPTPRAMGGPVYGGVPYLVGERGPELFVPNTNGSIAPNGAFGGVTINAYNRESAAVAMAWVSNARRSRLDSRMGVAA